jgi:hypothetical protein
LKVAAESPIPNAEHAEEGNTREDTQAGNTEVGNNHDGDEVFGRAVRGVHFVRDGFCKSLICLARAL